MEELIIKFSGPADFVPDAGQDHAHSTFQLWVKKRRKIQLAELIDTIHLALSTTQTLLQQHPAEAGCCQDI
jgi:hypothetical protein